jgi:hypothetical protein
VRSFFRTTRIGAAEDSFSDGVQGDRSNDPLGTRRLVCLMKLPDFS